MSLPPQWSCCPRKKRSVLQLLFIFLLTACLCNYVFLSNHQQQQDVNLQQQSSVDLDSPVLATIGNEEKKKTLITVIDPTDEAEIRQEISNMEALKASRLQGLPGGISNAFSKPKTNDISKNHESLRAHSKGNKNVAAERLNNLGKPQNFKRRASTATQQATIDYQSIPVLSYGPTRIPGYINHRNETLVLFGHVMRELTQRICARNIAQSNILVVSPEAPEVVDMLKDKTIETDQEEANLRREIHHKVGGSTLIRAHRQGHQYHGFGASAKLDQDWDNPPGWILLAMVDGQWDNDGVMQGALQLLQQSTVTYIVLGIGANTNGEVYGLDAVSQLLDLKYKVQVLSQSHAPSQRSRRQVVAPNADVTRRTLNLVFGSMTTTASKTGSSVHGYVFATQGLDLAIPTATLYNPTMGTNAVHYKQCPATEFEIQFYSTVVYAASAKSDARIRKQAPLRYKVLCEGLRMKLLNSTSVWMSGLTLEESEAICVKAVCGGQRKSACTTRILPKEELIGESDTPTAISESQSTKQNKPNLLLLMVDPLSRARFERSFPKTKKLIQMLNFTSFSQYTAVGNNSGPNQAALYSGMPLGNSRDSIATHDQKTAQGWLWDTLNEHGYATFKSEDGCVENSNMIQSIRPKVHHGEALLSMMCFDFQRPNCLGNTPASGHLVSHAKQFIEAYQEAHQPWAALLHFIDSHEDTQILEGTLDDPIFRFLYDFYNIRQCQDEAAAKDCKSVFDDTLVMLVSDHGLHYGSYLLSPKGLKERSQPMLHMSLPKKLRDSPNVKEALESNRHLHATHFDAYETIRQVLLPDEEMAGRTITGTSLLEPLPLERKDCATTDGVPSFVCNILMDDPSDQTARMPSPPSVMSYYADIPPDNKVTRPICDARPDNRTIFTSGQSCLCSTSHRKWYNCKEHPWAHPGPNTLKETFSLVDCVDTRSFEIHVQRDPDVVKRPEIAKAKEQSKSEQKPNILFLEVDSVSTAYADRHLPKTRELLDSKRLQKDSNGEFTCRGDNQLCSVELENMSVVGPSSVPNQVAVFGACMVTVGPEQCEQLMTDDKNRTICTNSSSPVHGMERINRFRTSATFCPVDDQGRSRWLFDIAKKAGYVTLFAEEFCYEGSIYVPQGNIFPLNVDVEPGRMYCELARLKAKREKLAVGGQPAWMFAYRAKAGKPNCVHEDGGYDSAIVPLDHVSTMWDAYPDIPKLAYVNAIAAHQYAAFEVMSDKAEIYDLILSSFLRKMLIRADATNTIIVVRADHGLQAGPMTPDYSIQVEALRPWTELIVPKNLKGVSLDTLFENQQRLITGFDFYKTLTSTIVGEDKDIMPTPPTWTTNVWQEEASIDRTCRDARVSNDYCLFEGQRTFTSPNIRSCNLVEEDQRLVCPLMADEFTESMSEEVVNSFYTTKIQKRICPRNEALEPATSANLTSMWGLLKEAARERLQPSPELRSEPFPRRLANILTSIVSDLSDGIYQAENRSLHVCQTGFGQGHSTALFLDASPNTYVHTFSKLNHTAQTPLLYKLQNINRNSKRMKHHKCDSCLAMLEFEKTKGIECDFLYGMPPTNKGYHDTILDLVRKAPCGVLLAGPPSKSLRDSQRVYFGLNNQWAKLRERDCIEDIHCFADNGGGQAQRFCMAVTTGRCQQSASPQAASNAPDTPGLCTAKIAELTRRIVLSQVCPASEVRVPPALKTPAAKTPSKAAVQQLASSIASGAASGKTKHPLTRLEKKSQKIMSEARKGINFSKIFKKKG